MNIDDYIDEAVEYFGLSAPELAHDLGAWFARFEEFEVSRAKFCEVMMVHLMKARK